MDLYRAYTIRENYQGRDSVVVDWFCEHRDAPVAGLESMAGNLAELDGDEKARAQTRLDQLLTSAEIDQLAVFIRTTSGFEVKRKKIDLPLPDGRKIPDYSGRSAGAEGEYFHIHEDSRYDLPVRITGFVDLSESPNTVSMA